MAIALIVSPSLIFSLKLFTDSSNPQTIAANLALNFPESDQLQRQALIGTGLMLFVISLAVNFLARAIITRTGPNSKRGKRTIKKLGAPTSTASVATASESPVAAYHHEPHESDEPEETGK
jgi:phosphate transport system permease protein